MGATLVALRKRPAMAAKGEPATESAAGTEPIPQSGGIEPAAAPAAEPAGASNIREQLAALQAGEGLLQRQREEEHRARLAAQMKIEQQPKQEQPKLSERDLEFLGARPGIQNDPNFFRTAGALPGYGTD